MKKIVSIILILIMVLSCTGCQKTMYNEADYVEKAREVFHIYDAENIEMRFIGDVSKDDEVLLWFMSGNEYQSHNYLPMSCKITEDGGYIFEHTYKTMERGMDIVVVNWHNGYVFCVNNPECKTIKIDDYAGKKEIEITEYPFVYFNDLIPSEYLFLDENENEIK